MYTGTTLTWSPSSETFSITRLSPATNRPERVTAPHTLFTLGDDDDGREEPLRIRAFFDSSVLEVFVNDRTVISTRVYSGCQGAVHFYAEGQEDSDAAVLLRGNVWDGLSL